MAGGLSCEHEPAPRHTWLWLPRQESQMMGRHSWCQRCGTVQYRGPRRAQDPGGLANRLSDLYLELEANGVVVADVQRRLVYRRLVREGLADPYGLGRSQQEEAIVKAITDHTTATPTMVWRHLHTV